MLRRSDDSWEDILPRCDIYIDVVIQHAVERIKKDTNESVQFGLHVVPGFPVCIASVAAILAMAAIIIIVAKKMSFIPMDKMY